LATSKSTQKWLLLKNKSRFKTLTLEISPLFKRHLLDQQNLLLVKILTSLSKIQIVCSLETFQKVGVETIGKVSYLQVDRKIKVSQPHKEEAMIPCWTSSQMIKR
jgi:hypothetical protein